MPNHSVLHDLLSHRSPQPWLFFLADEDWRWLSYIDAARDAERVVARLRDVGARQVEVDERPEPTNVLVRCACEVLGLPTARQPLVGARLEVVSSQHPHLADLRFRYLGEPDPLAPRTETAATDDVPHAGNAFARGRRIVTLVASSLATPATWQIVARSIRDGRALVLEPAAKRLAGSIRWIRPHEVVVHAEQATALERLLPGEADSRTVERVRKDRWDRLRRVRVVDAGDVSEGRRALWQRFGVEIVVEEERERADAQRG